MGKTDKQGRTNRNESDNLKRNGSRKQVPSSYDGEGEGLSVRFLTDNGRWFQRCNKTIRWL